MSKGRVKIAAQSSWRLFVPKLYTALKDGYDLSIFGKDLIAGLTVAIVALPLAMAFAIASGTTPDKGLVTAVVAGFLISALGGSRFQIGGPTGAFVVVVYNVIAHHGYDGLVMATLMAGVILVTAGFLRLGTIIKYIPQPVITGFTSGIAIIIFSSQVKDFLGLAIKNLPADFLSQWTVYAENLSQVHGPTLIVSVSSLAFIILMRRFAPQFPGFLTAIIAGSVAVAVLHIDTMTIGARFGDIPNMLPAPHWPHFDLAKIKELVPSALTIAFLAGIESLLSAIVADAMTSRRHRSNCELVAQGVANIASALFGGIPATGAIARTVTNIRAGGRTPVAGMAHAVFLFLCMYFLAPLARYVPLAVLSAILVVVAWNMSEIERVRHFLHATKGDMSVLVITILLTVLVDLTLAIEVGVVMSSIIFMYRMSNMFEIQTHKSIIQRDEDDFSGQRKPYTGGLPDLPKDIVMFQFHGPFFFGAISRLSDALEQIEATPRGYLLDFGDVPLMDASGETALDEFSKRCERMGIRILLCGLKGQPMTMIRRMGFLNGHHHIHTFDSVNDALISLQMQG